MPSAVIDLCQRNLPGVRVVSGNAGNSKSLGVDGKPILEKNRLTKSEWNCLTGQCLSEAARRVYWVELDVKDRSTLTIRSCGNAPRDKPDRFDTPCYRRCECPIQGTGKNQATLSHTCRAYRHSVEELRHSVSVRAHRNAIAQSSCRRHSAQRKAIAKSCAGA